MGSLPVEHSNFLFAPCVWHAEYHINMTLLATNLQYFNDYSTRPVYGGTWVLAKDWKGKVIKQTMFINEHYGYAELQRIVYKQKEIDDNKISTWVLHVKKPHI